MNAASRNIVLTLNFVRNPMSQQKNSTSQQKNLCPSKIYNRINDGNGVAAWRRSRDSRAIGAPQAAFSF